MTLTRLDQLAALPDPLHLALGVFDGLHAGHQAVITQAVRHAARDGGLAGLLTFDPHPIRVTAPGKAPASLLETLAHKERIARDLGIQVFIALHFDAALAAMEAGEFIESLTRAPVRTLAVGEDWRFGHNRSGDVPLLRREAQNRGFHLEALPPVMFEGERISSTRIRQAIRDGNLDAAAHMLGRPYGVSGKVVPGDQLGRTLGFPTANLGVRPTLNGTTRLLEVHLFECSADLYGQNLEVQFASYLRAEMKLPSLEALRLQISQDAHAARIALASPPDSQTSA